MRVCLDIALTLLRLIMVRLYLFHCGLALLTLVYSNRRYAFFNMVYSQHREDI